MSVQHLSPTIAGQLVGRDREAHLIALALVARQHVLLVGPPGTAKSHLCRTTAKAVEGASYGEWLLSPTTPPEAIFGPVSLTALREDRYEHVTDGYLPAVHLAYLDEVGRASPAILDTMLHLLGPERQARIGTQQVAAPLVAAIGSANTWPEDAAMLDRWLIRATVNYLRPADRAKLLDFEAPDLAPVCTLADLAAAHQTAKRLTWSKLARKALAAILDDMDDAGVSVSDRRFKAADIVCRAAAVLRGSTTTVEAEDLAVLEYVLWTNPKDAPKTAEIIARHAAPVMARLAELVKDAAEQEANGKKDYSRLADTGAKLEAILKDLGTLSKLAKGTESADDAAEATKVVKAALARTRARILGVDEDKVAKMDG